MGLYLILLLIVAAVFLTLFRQLSQRVARLEAELAVLRANVASGSARVMADGDGPVAIAPIAPPRTRAAPAEGTDRTLASLFERFVGGRLLIWAGGIAL